MNCLQIFKFRIPTTSRSSKGDSLALLKVEPQRFLPFGKLQSPLLGVSTSKFSRYEKGRFEERTVKQFKLFIRSIPFATYGNSARIEQPMCYLDKPYRKGGLQMSGIFRWNTAFRFKSLCLFYLSFSRFLSVRPYSSKRNPWDVLSFYHLFQVRPSKNRLCYETWEIRRFITGWFCTIQMNVWVKKLNYAAFVLEGRVDLEQLKIFLRRLASARCKSRQTCFPDAIGEASLLMLRSLSRKYHEKTSID